LGDSDGICDLECSGNKVVEMMPDAEKGHLTHTNHPIVNDDQGIYKKFLENAEGNIDPEDEKRISRSTTERRLEVLNKLIGQVSDLTVENIKNIFADRTAPLCVANKDHYTLGSIIMELKKDGPLFHIASDLPAGNKYQTLRF
jgi:hypothetical protein